MPRATLQMSGCVDFTHFWGNKGNETCGKTFINADGEIDCKWKRCVLLDGEIDCPEYHRSRNDEAEE